MRKTKEQIRKELLSKLSNQSGEEILEKSNAIKQKLFSLAEFKKADIVMFYASTSEEVYTGEMIDEALGKGKRVVLPRCGSLKVIVPKEIRKRENDLEKGTYGIYEPKPQQEDIHPKDIDLVVVPGVAFDRKNNRLGRGKGYYDKFLSCLPRNITSVGLAFDFQIVESLPKDLHDKPVSKIITN